MVAGQAPLTEQDVRDFMRTWVDAYGKGDSQFFDLLSPDVTMFAVSVPTRIDGRDTFRDGFAPSFLNTQRICQVLTPEVRLLGPDSALVTYHNRVLAGGASATLRTTVVLIRDNSGELRVVHSHNSPLTAGVSPAVTPSALENITALEERVASASAMTGTPK